MAKRPRPKANELPPEVVEKIRADVARWHPTIWQDEHPSGPTCTCGLSKKASKSMHFNWDGTCQIHSASS